MKHRFTALFLLPILLSSASIYSSAQNDSTLRMKLSGAAPAVASSAPGKSASRYFGREYQAKMNLPAPPAARAFYPGVYPGIDLTCYGDEFQLEYIFTVQPGADPSLIKLLFEGIQSVSMTHTGAIRIITPGGEIIQSAPLISLLSKGRKTTSEGRYEMGYGGVVTIDPGSDIQDSTQINNTRFNIVPLGGQPGGPNYDYYLSKYETSNAQYLRFLNDAEANTNTLRGSHMFFDKLGNVWINPLARKGSDEMFEIAGSRFAYDADKPAGSRYSHWLTKDGKAPYANHPLTGVSWFGAVKYCNWLTITDGRSAADCCYTEGTNSLDWAPVTATNWAKGSFGDAERQAWLSIKGFRLPMLDCQAGTITTNKYNEFYKAAAWSSTTNSTFAFGRDTFEGLDANYRDTADVIRPQTLPVGYFNGKRYLGNKITKPNENFYGIFDLSGNVSELMNDFGVAGNTSTRAVCGGSFDESPKPLTEGRSIAASATSTFGGFRTTTTFLPSESINIHILYSFFMAQEPGTHMPPPEGSWNFAPLRDAPAAPTLTPEQQFAQSRGGPSIDMNAPERTSDNITPDGLSYKTGVLEGGQTATHANQPAVSSTSGSEQGGTSEVQPTSTNIPGGNPIPPVVSTNKTLLISSLNPNSGAWIIVTPADASGFTSGSTTFTRTYTPGTLVTLNAATNAGMNIFQAWFLDGIYFSSNHIESVSMTTNMSMTALYVAPPAVSNKTLVVTSQNPNSGVAITVSPSDKSGLASGSTVFTRTYDPGTLVTLNAPTNTGSTIFQEWLQDGSFFSSNHIATVSMTTNMTMTALYVAPPAVSNKTLVVTSQNPNSGVAITVSPSDKSGLASGSTVFTRTYDPGTLVTLNAPTNTGSTIFQEWLQDGLFFSSNHITSVTMSTNMTMSAVYVTVPVITNETLIVNSSNPNSGVSITINPSDTSGLASGSTAFTRTYAFGTLVTLNAPTNSGVNSFQQWLRDGVFYAGNHIASIAMITNTTMTAVYVSPPPNYILTVVSSSPLSGVPISVNPIDVNSLANGVTIFTRLYVIGSFVTLTAPPVAAGNVFQKWQSDGIDVTTNFITTIFMNTNHIVSAIYIYKPGPIDPPPISPGGV